MFRMLSDGSHRWWTHSCSIVATRSGLGKPGTSESSRMLNKHKERHFLEKWPKMINNAIYPCHCSHVHTQFDWHRLQAKKSTTQIRYAQILAVVERSVDFCSMKSDLVVYEQCEIQVMIECGSCDWRAYMSEQSAEKCFTAKPMLPKPATYFLSLLK